MVGQGLRSLPAPRSDAQADREGNGKMATAFAVVAFGALLALAVLVAVKGSL